MKIIATFPKTWIAPNQRLTGQAIYVSYRPAIMLNNDMILFTDTEEIVNIGNAYVARRIY